MAQVQVEFVRRSAETGLVEGVGGHLAGGWYLTVPEVARDVKHGLNEFFVDGDGSPVRLELDVNARTGARTVVAITGDTDVLGRLPGPPGPTIGEQQ